MAPEIFIDASYIIALVSITDRYHAQAAALANQLARSPVKLITSRAVLLEIGNALARQRFRQAGALLLTMIERDPQVEIVPLSETLYAQALQLFGAREDKEWSLVDCISFIIMQERHIGQALSADEHFRQAGYEPLLRA